MAELARGCASLGRSTEFGSNVRTVYVKCMGTEDPYGSLARQTHAGQVFPPSYRRPKRVLLQHHIGAAIALETREKKCDTCGADELAGRLLLRRPISRLP